MRRVTDRFDIALLNLLQANARATADELAVEVPLSPSAIARRLRRLRRDGVVAADVALLAEDVTPDRVLAVILVQLHDHDPSGSYARLRDRLVAAPEVQLFLEISGSFDLSLLVVTRGLDEFNRFVDTQVAPDPAVRRYETTFVKKRLKLAPIVTLDDRDVAPR